MENACLTACQSRVDEGTIGFDGDIGSRVAETGRRPRQPGFPADSESWRTLHRACPRGWCARGVRGRGDAGTAGRDRRKRGVVVVCARRRDLSPHARWIRAARARGRSAIRTFFLYLAYSALTTVAAVAGSSPSASMSRSYALPLGSTFAGGSGAAFLKMDIISAVGGWRTARRRRASKSVRKPPASGTAEERARSGQTRDGAKTFRLAAAPSAPERAPARRIAKHAPKNDASEKTARRPSPARATRGVRRRRTRRRERRALVLRVAPVIAVFPRAFGRSTEARRSRASVTEGRTNLTPRAIASVRA